jgi:hypothetical protein
MARISPTQKKKLLRKRGIARLQKLAEFGRKDGIFWKPTKEYAEQVYNAINRTVFKGTLTRPKILLRDYDRKGVWGECEGDSENGRRFCTVIRMNRHIPSSRAFIQVMTHEMVHQWEWEKGPHGRMTHGKRTFYSWKPECARWGITLV